jgi:hypothetical protein
MHLSTCAGVLVGAILGLAPATAGAAEEYDPYRSDVAVYPIEVEPHFSFGAENVYGMTGYGAGLRLGLPLLDGSLGRVPDNLALTFGGDLVHYDNCYYAADCGANYVMVPVAAQWNIFVARRVSLLAEGGVFVYRGFFDGCRPGDGPGCIPPSDFGILPTLAIGVRVHLGPAAAFTARLGYPTTTLGVSFF